MNHLMEHIHKVVLLSDDDFIMTSNKKRTPGLIMYNGQRKSPIYIAKCTSGIVTDRKIIALNKNSSVY